jgi:hypothetical protein
MPKNDAQFSLSLPEPKAKVAAPPPTAMQALPMAKVYSYAAIKAEKDRHQDAIHFGKILQLVKHFK